MLTFVVVRSFDSWATTRREEKQKETEEKLEKELKTILDKLDNLREEKQKVIPHFYVVIMPQGVAARGIQ